MERTHSYHEREQAVLEEYAAMAERHIALSNGRMELLPADPHKYPAQQLENHWVEGDPQHAGLVEIVATQAESRFPTFMEQLKTPESQAQLRTYGEILKRGSNIMLVTNHGDTIDIALALAGPYCQLDQMGYSYKTGIIISKMISRIGYILDPSTPSIPAVDALKLACDDVFLSFPRTESMRQSKVFSFVPDHIDRHNRKIRSLIADRQSGSTGYLLGVAGSGSTDKRLDGDSDTYLMGGLSEGTIKMMKESRTFVLPMAVWLHDERPIFRFCDLRSVTSSAEAHEVMKDIADTLNQEVAGKRFIYGPAALGAAAVNAE